MIIDPLTVYGTIVAGALIIFMLILMKQNHDDGDGPDAFA